MKYKKKFPEKIKSQYKQVGKICDICSTYAFFDNWDTKSGNNSEITIEALIGNSYPEADTRNGYAVDICPECFADKVKPAIEALGVKFKEFDAEDRYFSEYSDYADDISDYDLNKLRAGRKVYGEE